MAASCSERFTDTCRMSKILENPQPKVGLVIGTFAAVHYVHLALEAWKRNCPEIQVLVHDDGSAKRNELRVFCEFYGAAFIINQQRGRWTVGDISTYVDGLDWTKDKKLDLLVKMSRRFGTTPMRRSITVGLRKFTACATMSRTF